MSEKEILYDLLREIQKMNEIMSNISNKLDKIPPAKQFYVSMEEEE